MSLEGNEFVAGNVDVPFALMSVAKPFTLALVVDAVGPEIVLEQVGVDATGRPFDSVAAVEESVDGRTNPMVNAGAIATTALLPAADAAERWQRVVEGLSSFAGHTLAMDEAIYASASATNVRNRAITAVLHAHGRLVGDPADALDLYTRQSCLRVTARDLAVMGATLADGGVNPETGVAVVSAETARFVLAVMATAGLYTELRSVALRGRPAGQERHRRRDRHGRAGQGWLGHVLPATGSRTATASAAGSAARALSEELGLDLFASAPSPP